MGMSPVHWDPQHALIGRVVALNSGGPLMTVASVRVNLDDGDNPTQFEVCYFDGSLSLCSSIIDARLVEILSAEDVETWGVSVQS